MDRYRLRISHPWLVTLASALVVVVAAGSTAAAEEMAGQREFQAHCAVCHGTNGLGDGPVADLLKVPPANLQVLKRNNDGKFPALKIAKTIDGRRRVAAHGTRDMPVWGDRYRQEADVDNGPFSAEVIARSRILELVSFLQSMQTK